MAPVSASYVNRDLGTSLKQQDCRAKYSLTDTLLAFEKLSQPTHERSGLVPEALRLKVRCEPLSWKQPATNPANDFRSSKIDSSFQSGGESANSFFLILRHALPGSFRFTKRPHNKLSGASVFAFSLTEGSVSHPCPVNYATGYQATERLRVALPGSQTGPSRRFRAKRRQEPARSGRWRRRGDLRPRLVPEQGRRHLRRTRLRRARYRPVDHSARDGFDGLKEAALGKEGNVLQLSRAVTKSLNIDTMDKLSACNKLIRERFVIMSFSVLEVFYVISATLQQYTPCMEWSKVLPLLYLRGCRALIFQDACCFFLGGRWRPLCFLSALVNNTDRVPTRCWKYWISMGQKRLRIWGGSP